LGHTGVPRAITYTLEHYFGDRRRGAFIFRNTDLTPPPRAEPVFTSQCNLTAFSIVASLHASAAYDGTTVPTKAKNKAMRFTTSPYIVD